MYIHAVFGGIALLSGLIALILRKGSLPHIISGKVFFWFMLSSALIALVVSCLPEHENPFLFSVGVFSSYLIITGKRAIRYKKFDISFTFDQIISVIMILTGLSMILVPIILESSLNIVLSVFGTFGIVLSIQDLIGFRNPEKLRKAYLQAHLGKMIGGYIAAVTAFIVVNQFFPPLIGWLGPTVVLTPIIIFWTRKVKKPS